MAKAKREFFAVETVAPTICDGLVPELTERILAVESRPRGIVTRILHFAAGCDTTPNGVQAHDFWEEVYILDGSITDLTLGETFSAGMYACRPPGMRHGPWRTNRGCTTFEVRYPALGGASTPSHVATPGNAATPGDATTPGNLAENA